MLSFVLTESWMVKKSPLVCVLSHFNCVQLFATLGTIAHQAPLSMGFSRLRILEWGYHAFLQGIFPTQGSNLCVLNLLHWQAGFLPLPPPGKPEKSPQLTVKNHTAHKYSKIRPVSNLPYWFPWDLWPTPLFITCLMKPQAHLLFFKTLFINEHFPYCSSLIKSSP